MEKKLFNKRALKQGSYTVIVAAIALAIVIALNLLVSQLPASILRPDTSAEKVYSIGTQTEDILKRIEEDIIITHYIDGSDNTATTSEQTNYIRGILDRYEEASSHITVKEVDLVNSNVAITENSNISVNTVAVKSEKRAKSITTDEMFMCVISGYEGEYMSRAEYDYMVYYYQMYGQTLPEATDYFFGENEITGAIDYVMQDELPVVYYLSGHSENAMGDAGFASICVDENVELKELKLQSGEKAEVPEDANALIINAPMVDITEDESTALIEYLKVGGSIILNTLYGYTEAETSTSLTIAYSEDTMPNLAAVCKYMGLKSINTLVCDTGDGRYYQSPIYLTPAITGNGITSLLDSTNYYFYAQLSHPITTDEECENTVETYDLLKTSDKAYAYSLEDPNGDKATKTTYSVGYQSILMDENDKALGELIWFGSPTTFDDSYVNGTGNAMLFREILEKTCEKAESVSLIGKEISSGKVNATVAQANMVLYVAVIAVPLIVIAFGIVIWALRRRK